MLLVGKKRLQGIEYFGKSIDCMEENIIKRVLSGYIWASY
jgi:hypothetical protein